LSGLTPPDHATMPAAFAVIDGLFVIAAAVAIVAALTAFEVVHDVAKPLATALLIVAAWQRGLNRREAGFARLLVAGLAFSLAGDVALIFDRFFIAGLVAFLCAHLCYIALFRRGVPWLPSLSALAATLLAAVALYVFLFPGLDPVLRVAVAVYATVIAVMAAQAIGRAVVLGEGAGAAAGAVLFMVSDSLLATDRFAHPLPLAPLWVLATYWLAQWLIARLAAPAGAAR